MFCWIVVERRWNHDMLPDWVRALAALTQAAVYWDATHPEQEGIQILYEHVVDGIPFNIATYLRPQVRYRS